MDQMDLPTTFKVSWSMPFPPLIIYEEVIYKSYREAITSLKASLGKVSLLLNLKLFSLCSLISFPFPPYEFSGRE